MAEKHHPASSKTARERIQRAMRHKDKAVVEAPKHKQPRRYSQPIGFVRGARIRASRPS